MKGKPILGVLSGFMFGLLLGPTLWLWGVIEFHSPLMWILPIAGVALGLAMAAWAPFGRGRSMAMAGGASAPDPVAEVPAMDAGSQLVDHGEAEEIADTAFLDDESE